MDPRRALILLVSFGFATLMGYAIQRGATCMVAAVDEIVSARRAHRLIAMLEASLWVSAGLVIAQFLHLAGAMPAPLPVTIATAAGGALLGLGAWVNRACVFGAIARLGSGEWSYVFTPLGFLLGCWLYIRLRGAPLRPAPGESALVLHWANILLLPVCLFLVWRALTLVAALQESGRGALGRLWHPRAATVVIGVAFLFLLMTQGAWAYTDVLAEIAQGIVAMLSHRVVLLVALFAGAFIAGWTAKTLQHRPMTLAGVIRCSGGGVLMGLGSMAIPGSNDGLILLGVPLLLPHAWIALAAMLATIAGAMQLQRSNWLSGSGRRAD